MTSDRPAGPWPAHPISRRRLLGHTGLAAAGGLLLSGCGSSVAAGLIGSRARDRLTYWNLFTGGDGTRMVGMEQSYARAHPEISLDSSTFTWGNPYYTKLSLATLGHRPPDVAIAHLTRAKTLAEAGLLESIEDGELADSGMPADKFAARPLRAARLGGKLFAVPLDVHPLVLFYNTDLCAKAGLLNSDGSLVDLGGPEKFVAALRKAKQVTGKYGGVWSINNDTSTGYIIFYSLYQQLGGEVLRDGGRTVVLDDDKAVRVLSFLRDLSVGQGLIPSSIDYGAATVAFTQGQAAFYVQGEWEVSTFLTAKMPFSMTRFPNLYGTYAVHADSHMFVIPRQPVADPARRRRSLAFIRGMLDQSLAWAAGGHVPTWLPTANSPEYHQLRPQSNYADVIDAVVYDPDGWYAGSGSDLTNVIGAQVAAVEAGQLSPQAAVASMRAQLEKLAAMPSPIA
jgi:multiple sugar transport system substrate-binding protein